MYTLCLMNEGNHSGYTWHIVQKTEVWQMFQKWWIFKRIPINLMGQLQCNSNPSKVLKPLNLGCPYSLSGYNWKMTLFIIIFNFITQCVLIVSKNYFKPRVNAPISDKKKFNFLSFGQRTPCQSNNGSKYVTCVITNIFVVSKSM